MLYLGIIYVVVLNLFGAKPVWISAGLGFLLALITMGGAATFAAILLMPAILRLMVSQIWPFIALEIELLKNK
jgi:hypothetical protein